MLQSGSERREETQHTLFPRNEEHGILDYNISKFIITN
jgi:hypothetical protein